MINVTIHDNTENKLIWVTVNCSNINEITKRAEFYKKVIHKLFAGKAVSLVTIQPQPYSLGNEISLKETRVVKGSNYLVSRVHKFDSSLAEDIAFSEEFRRTLLILVSVGSFLSDNSLLRLRDLVKGNIQRFSNGVIFCEDDGESLLLHNTGAIVDDVVVMARSLSYDVSVEKSHQG